jgi:DNA-binding LacI/PurR family transcriptional regulator
MFPRPLFPGLLTTGKGTSKTCERVYRAMKICRYKYNPASGCEGLKLLVKSKKPLTAIFSSNDLLAIGAIEGARQMGLSIPEDISIIGFDDMQIASFVSPTLTTIRQPTYEMGKQGAEALIDIIERKSGKPVHKLLDISLVARESTGAISS